MPPGDHERERRVGNVAAFEVAGPDVPFDVIHPDQRNPAGEGERLGEGDAGQQGPDEPGPVRHRDRLDVIHGDPGVRERLLHDGREVQQVLPGSDLGHHPSELRVLGDLRGNDVRKDAPAVFDDGRRGLVAGGLDPQDEHGVQEASSNRRSIPRLQKAPPWIRWARSAPATSAQASS